MAKTDFVFLIIVVCLWLAYIFLRSKKPKEDGVQWARTRADSFSKTEWLIRESIISETPSGILKNVILEVQSLSTGKRVAIMFWPEHPSISIARSLAKGDLVRFGFLPDPEEGFANEPATYLLVEKAG